MMKRVTWFVAGAAAGATGVTYAKRKVKAAAAQLAPSNVARGAVEGVRNKGRNLVDAVREGRQAMRDKEAELRATRDGVDELAIPVEPGQVIVLSDVRDLDALRAQPRRRRRA